MNARNIAIRPKCSGQEKVLADRGETLSLTRNTICVGLNPELGLQLLATSLLFPFPLQRGVSEIRHHAWLQTDHDAPGPWDEFLNFRPTPPRLPPSSSRMSSGSTICRRSNKHGLRALLWSDPEHVQYLSLLCLIQKNGRYNMMIIVEMIMESSNKVM